MEQIVLVLLPDQQVRHYERQSADTDENVAGRGSRVAGLDDRP